MTHYYYRNETYRSNKAFLETFLVHASIDQSNYGSQLPSQ